MFLFLLMPILSVIALIIGLIKPGKVVRFGNIKNKRSNYINVGLSNEESPN